jgi:hypothetical protein
MPIQLRIVLIITTFFLHNIFLSCSPPNNSSSGTVTQTSSQTGGGSSNSDNNDNEPDDQLLLTTVEPASGDSGQTITITGNGFFLANENIEVYFAGVLAPILAVAPNIMTVKAPALPENPTAAVTIRLVRGGEETLLTNAFTYLNNDLCEFGPTISSFVPANGAGSGGNVTLFGSGLDTVTTITVGNHSIPESNATANDLTFAMPDLNMECYNIAGCPQDLIVANANG